MCIALKAIERLEVEIELLKQMKEELTEQISYYDTKLSTLYHSIENESHLNVVNGYKIYRELKKILTERRKIKSEYYALISLLGRIDPIKNAVSEVWERQNKESYEQFTSIKEILTGTYELADARIPVHV